MARKKTKGKAEQKRKMEKSLAKFSCIAGLTVLLSFPGDVYNIVVGQVPKVIWLIEIFILAILLWVANFTNKFDSISESEGVQKVDGFLSIFSIMYFMFVRIILCELTDSEFEISLFNDRFFGFVSIVALGIAGCVGMMYLLSRHSKKRNSITHFFDVNSSEGLVTFLIFVLCALLLLFYVYLA